MAAADGTVRWTLRYLASAKFDYGNAPRTTPLVSGDKVWLYGAAGHLHCVELTSGAVLWKKNVREEFKAVDDNAWGLCSSPLLVDGKLILNPGGLEASVVGDRCRQRPGDLANSRRQRGLQLDDRGHPGR